MKETQVRYSVLWRLRGRIASLPYSPATLGIYFLSWWHQPGGSGVQEDQQTHLSLFTQVLLAPYYSFGERKS